MTKRGEQSSTLVQLRGRFVCSLTRQGFPDDEANEVAQSLGFLLEVHRSGVAALRRRSTPLFERIEKPFQSRDRMDQLKDTMCQAIDALRFDFELAVLIADGDQPRADRMATIMKMHDTVRYLSDQLSKVDEARAYFDALAQSGQKPGQSIEANFAQSLVMWLEARDIGYSHIEAEPHVSAARWAWLFFGFQTNPRSAIRAVRRYRPPTTPASLKPLKPAGPFDGLGIFNP